MLTTVLFLHLASGAVATIPGFHDPEECNATGKWYQDHSKDHNAVQYYCGPGPRFDAPEAAQEYVPPPSPQYVPPPFVQLFGGLLHR